MSSVSRPRVDDLGHLSYDVAGPPSWYYQQQVPLERFAPSSLPSLPGAPTPDRDPYAAVGRTAELAMWFQDLFGNVSSWAGHDTLGVPVTYSDPLLPVGSWPATTTRFEIAEALDGARLTVVVEQQSIGFQPAADQVAGDSARRTEDLVARLCHVYYQLMQPDVTAAVLTTLQQRPGGKSNKPGGRPARLTADIGTLRGYAHGCLVVADASARLQEQLVDAAVAPDLESVRAHYGVAFDDLATANASQPVERIFSSTVLQLPVIATFRAGDTVAELAATEHVRAVTVLLDHDNEVLLLNPGTELRTPTRATVVPRNDLTAGALAAELGCGLRRLALANRKRESLLTPGFVFEVRGYEVHVHPEGRASHTTLELVAKAFAHHHRVEVGVEELVELNADRPGMFRSGAVLHVTDYVVRQGDTLAVNGTGLDAAALAPLNTGTRDLFPPRTPLLLTHRPQQAEGGESLASYADNWHVNAGTLLRHNAELPLLPDSGLRIPGTWSWPDERSGLRVPYAVREGDSLVAIGRRFGTSAAGLVETNAAMPAMVRADVTLTVHDQQVTTPSAMSLEALRGLFNPPASLSELADVLADRHEVLSPGTLLLCPPGVLGSEIGDQAGVLTAEEAAQPFGLTPVALLAANAGTPGLLVDGVQLTAPGGEHETVTPADTLTALLARFERASGAVSISDLVTANAEVAFLRSGAQILLPAPPARVSVVIGEGGTWRFPGAVFPIDVALELRRRKSLVDPALRATAARAVTQVPLHRPADPEQDGAPSLALFADQLQRAIPVLRVGTAKVHDVPATDVWAVLFDSEGIEKVSVVPPLRLRSETERQPRTYALRPLANRLLGRDGVSIGELAPDGRLLPARPRSFQDADLEAWARAFLGDVELVLSADYVAGGYLLDAACLDALLAVKGRLAAAVAGGVAMVLDVDGATDDLEDRRQAAAEQLRQSLLVSLTAGYTTSAVLQYDAFVRSVWRSDEGAGQRPRGSARLAGTATSVTRGPASVDVTPSKLSLVDGSSHFHLMASTPDVSADRDLRLPLVFRVTDLEFDVLPGIEGYETSEWLSFVTPLDGGPAGAVAVDLGTPTVPLPLRAAPALPILVSHRALVPTSADVIDAALVWQYRCHLEHRSAAQDTVYVEVTLNPPDGLRASGGDLVKPGLFDALAQYAAVMTPLRDLLGGVAKAPDSEPSSWDRPREALRTMRQLAEDVADAWADHWVPAEPVGSMQQAGATSGLTEEVHRYSFLLESDDHGDWDALVLTQQAGPDATRDGPGLGWPQITCIAPDGSRLTLAPLVETGTPAAEASQVSRRYLFPGEPSTRVPAGSLLGYELTFPAVAVGTYESATSRVWVTRNERLLGPDGPATAPAFVYQTSRSQPMRPVRPFVDITSAIPVGAWPDGLSGPGPLAAVMSLVAGSRAEERTVAMGAEYSFPLVDGAASEVEVFRPVGHTQSVRWSDTLERDLHGRMNDWVADHRVGGGGTWYLSLTVFSASDPTVPVLRLGRLRSPRVVAPSDAVEP